MDFDLSEELGQPIGLARDFARQVLRPAEEAIDRIADPVEAFTSEIHRDVTRKMYEIDLHKLGLPVEMGGLGLPAMARLAIDEEIAVGGAGLASQLLLTPLAANFIAMLGLGAVHPVYKEHLEAYLDDSEGVHSGAWTITEPDVGSDCFTFGVPSIRMRARATAGGAGYVIEGTKSAWCSNGWLADMLVAMICLDPDAGMEGTATFLIPADWPGITKGRPIDKIGLRALNQCDFVFDGVEVPKEFLLAPPGPGYRPLLESFVTPGNTSVGTLALGVARAAYETGLAYAKVREQGGHPIIGHQLVAKKLFDAYRAIEASRLMLQKSTWVIEQGRPSLELSFAARASACETAMRVTADMMLLHGGFGITREYSVEKYYRDAAPLQVMDGSVDRIAVAAADRL